MTGEGSQCHGDGEGNREDMSAELGERKGREERKRRDISYHLCEHSAK
jgi:hypothetical protein